VDAAAHLALQHGHLISQRGILCFKPALGLEKRGNQGKEENISATDVKRFSRSITDEVFGTHRRAHATISRRNFELRGCAGSGAVGALYGAFVIRPFRCIGIGRFGPCSAYHAGMRFQ
jgi:hypothetical protein